MKEAAIDALKYPIGEFQKPEIITQAIVATWIQEIADLPQQLKKASSNLNSQQLETPYRPDGWTVRQTIHHVADSHINAYCRFRLALTEDIPSVRPYDENAWAALPDGANAPIEWSLALLEMLHKRWTFLLENMTESDFEKKFYHPATKHSNPLKLITGMYAWHGKHHVAHITSLRKRMDW